MSDNNIVSVKVGNKVLSSDGYSWTDVTATYPYVGGTLQTEFGYDDSTIQSLGNPVEEGGYFIYDDMIWKLCKFASYPYIYAAKVLPTYDSGNYGLPIHFDAYLDGVVLYADDTWEHELTEMPQNGGSFYFPNGDLQLLSNVTIYPTMTAGTTATDVPPAPPTPVHNNGIASVKLDDDKVFSIDIDSSGERWDDVTAKYPYIGGTLQTEFQYFDGDIPKTPDETSGYFVCDDRIWSLAKWNGGVEYIYACPLYPSWAGSNYGLPLYFDVYSATILYSDLQLQNPLTEFPHEGDTFYYLDSDAHTVSNATIYHTMIAGSTATDVPPTPPTVTYNKPLIYNRDLDCIEKSLGNIEVVGALRTGSMTTADLAANNVTTPNLTATNATVTDLTVNNPVENLTVDNLTVTDTASINHATIVTEEDIHSEADFIELRVNNPLPTPSTGSGFKVKNYDGNNNDLKLVTDSSGTFRIGAENQLQPIATREEASALVNNDLLAWDATAQQLKHITRPTVNGTALKAIVTNGAVTGYDWGSSGGSGVSFIGTRAAYNTAKLIPEGQDGHIPAGSLVIITDEDELIIGDEQ